MRTPQSVPAPLPAVTVPLLDSSCLPAEEEWEVLEALNAHVDRFDADEDRLAGFGVSAGDFD
jgi:hypothetical protein